MFVIPIMMLIGIGLAVNNAKAVVEAIFGKTSPFLRTPKQGTDKKAQYRPLKDFTSIFEIALGSYCSLGLYIFFGYSNAIVSPFLALYAAGFLFVGILSIIHFKRPETVYQKIKLPHLVR